jgi:hypothetical protein
MEKPQANVVSGLGRWAGPAVTMQLDEEPGQPPFPTCEFISLERFDKSESQIGSRQSAMYRVG